MSEVDERPEDQLEIFAIEELLRSVKSMADSQRALLELAEEMLKLMREDSTRNPTQ